MCRDCTARLWRSVDPICSRRFSLCADGRLAARRARSRTRRCDKRLSFYSAVSEARRSLLRARSLAFSLCADGRLAARRARSRTRRCDKRLSFSSAVSEARRSLLRARSLANFRSRASVLSEAREGAVAAVWSQASADGVAPSSSVGCTFGVGHSESMDVASKN